jgi:exo-1,4-beta-D-glucosaminidase
MSRSLEFCAFAVVLISAMGSAAFAGEAASERPQRFYLHKNWQIQSSCEVKETGGQISTAGFEAKGWHKADMPSTVVGALVSDRTYPDPNYGTNLKSFPGMNYSDKGLFANEEMPERSPFRCSWWYRTEFTLPSGVAEKTSWLDFLGINYRANIWINGEKIADAKDIAGAYRSFEFNVSGFLRAGKANALAIEIFAPGKDDLGITWVDWNPTPPDKAMGIWKEVFLTQSGEVTVRKPLVASKLDGDYKTAALAISAIVRNGSDHSVRGVLHLEVAEIKIAQPVELSGKESKTVRFTAEQFAGLKLAHPRLWWPYQLGTPNLYTAKLSFEAGKRVLDSASVNFGIREVSSEFTEKGFRLFKVNGRKVLIRGAAWAPDLLFRWSSARLDGDLAYVREMGLNAIRLEGRLDRDEFFEKTDRLGILVMAGWTCCDAWERWGDWKGNQSKIAAESLRDQITRLRNHPSVFVWLNGSDTPPPPKVETMYLGILRDLEWPNPTLSSAGETSTKVTGNSGVKMTGPYEYVPPVYWLTDKDAGGAYGFNTETSPGPAIPTRGSLERFIPKDHLWPIDDVWNYHAGLERFTTVNIFSEGLNRRYGPATSLDDYERKAQAMAYDGQRAMFEAYARNKYTSTGVIQWMLNNAWPSLIWHLYDYYLVPGGGYFGTKKACEPVHIQYSYDDNSAAVINNTFETLKGVKVSAKIFSIAAQEKASRATTLDLGPDSVTKAFDLPKPDGVSTTYFLRLRLDDATGNTVSDNFYWFSTKADGLDWEKRIDTTYTPQSEFGDLTGLNSLPQVRVEVKAKVSAAKGFAQVSVRNTSQSVAFMIHLRLTRSQGGEDITPIFWTDNYLSLLPGEGRDLAARYEPSLENLVLEIDGFNVAPETIKLSSPM